MNTAPRSLRTHIGLFGRRNVGKSSVLNALTRQEVAIVSATPGTTTDPVEKPMEFLPLGPVLFVDTAGIDDEGALGEQRIAQDAQGARADRPRPPRGRGGLVGPVRRGAPRRDPRPLTPRRRRPEQGRRRRRRRRPRGPPRRPRRSPPSRRSPRRATASPSCGRRSSPRPRPTPRRRDASSADLVAPGDLVVLVMPIDKEAPKGRLILPQVQAIRDLLDAGAISVVVKEHELRRPSPGSRSRRARRHRLAGVPSGRRRHAARRPADLLLDPLRPVPGRPRRDGPRRRSAIDRLKAGDRVLVAEACTHHPIGEDIGRVKIPRWLRAAHRRHRSSSRRSRGATSPTTSPASPSSSTAAAAWGTGARCSRASSAAGRRASPSPTTGSTIAYSLGILERALEPFPAALRGLPRSPARGRAPRGGDDVIDRAGILAWLRETDPEPPLAALAPRGRREARARGRRGPPARPRRDLATTACGAAPTAASRPSNNALPRYRMTKDEILAVRRAGAARSATARSSCRRARTTA